MILNNLKAFSLKLKLASNLSNKLILKSKLNHFKRFIKMPINYPKVRRDETIVENFHGIDVNFLFINS